MANQSRSSGDPILCVNNCGFFGNPATNNLCSKCYKDFLMKQPKELGNTMTPMDKRSDEETKESMEQMEGEGIAQQGENASGIAQQGENASVESSSSENPENQPSNRCSFCRKRVGLTGFKCRCGQTFCSMHRYSDKHNCVFDYKAAGQDAIARANPIVKADKVEKI